jgi:hypothetical protein
MMRDSQAPNSARAVELSWSVEFPLVSNFGSIGLAGLTSRSSWINRGLRCTST